MQLAFTKMHGLGNDFVVIDATRPPHDALFRQPDPALLRRLAERHFGVGCDQVLVVEPPPSADVDFGYRIFNADGSEVGQCGNGVRCLARFVRDRGLSKKAQLRVRTLSATMELRLRDDGLVTVDMGVPRFDPADIPLNLPARAPRYRLDVQGQTVEFGAVSMGNPHAVIAVRSVDSAPVAALGPALQRQAAFPQSVNVGFLQVIDAGNARLRVYERGSGETLACGSGACAAMAVGQSWGMLGPRVTMQLRGGTLELEWAGEGQPLYMTGPAVTVFEGRLAWPD
jgi:diaminopimelate epimerase